MQITELYNQKWKVDKDVVIREMDMPGLTLIEQECGFLKLRVGLLDESKSEVHVNCSDQTMITELKNCEYFTINQVEISTHERTKGFIISIKGIMPENALTIRKKIPVYSDEELQKRSERAKVNLKRK